MPLLLRMVRQNRWLKAEAAPFLDVDDVPADSLADLPTSNNVLSVFEVNEEQSNVERIVRAVAVGRDKLMDAGYVVFDSGPLKEAGIEVRKTLGNTADKEANNWHCDLVVSGNKLIALTKVIFRIGNSGTVLKTRLKELVEEGTKNGQIPEKFRARFP